MGRLALRALAVCACVVALSVSAGGQDRDGKDNVVGTKWSYEITNGKEKEEGQFRAYNAELFKGAKKVGKSHPKSATETTLVITDYEPLNGKAVLRKVGHHPAIWKGTLTKSNGSSWEMKVTVKDK